MLTAPAPKVSPGGVSVTPTLPDLATPAKAPSSMNKWLLYAALIGGAWFLLSGHEGEDDL